jgi:hypothetical protein
VSLFDDLISLTEWTATRYSDSGPGEVVLPDDSDDSTSSPQLAP